MADQQIPLTTDPNQQFQISLAVDGETIQLGLEISFNEMAAYWVMKVLDAAGNTLLDNIPLITGTWPAANLLAQYDYLNIGSAYIINLGNAPIDYPNATDLGSDFILIWSDTAA